MKVLVTGSRNFKDYNQFFELVSQHITFNDSIVCGDSEGVEEMALRLADDKGLKVEVVKLNPQFKNAAWFIRNKNMVSKVDRAVVLWDTKSKGTAKTIKMLQECEKELVVYKVTE